MKISLTKQQLYRIATDHLIGKNIWKNKYPNYLKSIRENYIIINTNYLFYNIKRTLNYIKQLIFRNNNIYYLIEKKYYPYLRRIYKLNHIYILNKWINGYLTNFINNKYNKIRSANYLIIQRNVNELIKKQIKNKSVKIKASLPDTFIVFNFKKHLSTIAEASTLNIPMVTFFSNTDNFSELRSIDYSLPLNSLDTIYSRKFYINLINNNLINSYYLKYIQITQNYSNMCYNHTNKIKLYSNIDFINFKVEK